MRLKLFGVNGNLNTKVQIINNLINYKRHVTQTIRR